jgi:pimeloyl-ACP methyl ester carboxylesterase
MDSHGIDRAVLVGHSYGGGVALATAQLAPERVEALVLLASVGPGCLTWADWMLAAPLSGEFFAFVAWRLTPWFARAVLAAARQVRRRPLGPDQAVNWQIWANARHDHGPLWRSFLAEQRALVRELGGLTAALPAVAQPVLLVADPHDMIVPVRSTQRLAAALPDARIEMLDGPGHHLPRRAAPQIAAAIAGFLGTLENRGAAA